MEYFDDIMFLRAGVVPHCRRPVSRRFAETYHLQFVLSGRMRFGIDDGPRAVLDRPTAFWHHPRHSYRYGPVGEEGWYHHWVVFHGPRGRQIMEKGFLALSEAGHAPVYRPAEFAEVFQTLVADVNAGDPARQAARVLRLETLLRMLVEDRRDTAPRGPHHTALENLAGRIRKAPLTSYDFGREARRMHL